MKFDDLDTLMRQYETVHDTFVEPGLFMVARIDGRGFTHLTKDVHKFEAPFDERFRDYMVATVQHVMQCGFRAIYGYTQSDEISVLLHRDENSFGRKLRKFDSVLAGEASARFSLLLGAIGAFDCRISQLPTVDRVVDYFRWRSEDAYRNALNAHCYWALRKRGENAAAAAKTLYHVSIAEKTELLLRQDGVSFDNLPSWQRCGVGLYWQDVETDAFNPRTGESGFTYRRRLKIDMDLPQREDYSRFIENLLLHEHPDLAPLAFAARGNA